MKEEGQCKAFILIWQKICAIFIEEKPDSRFYSTQSQILWEIYLAFWAFARAVQTTTSHTKAFYPPLKIWKTEKGFGKYEMRPIRFTVRRYKVAKSQGKFGDTSYANFLNGKVEVGIYA